MTEHCYELHSLVSTSHNDPTTLESLIGFLQYKMSALVYTEAFNRSHPDRQSKLKQTTPLQSAGGIDAIKP